VEQLRAQLAAKEQQLADAAAAVTAADGCITFLAAAFADEEARLAAAAADLAAAEAGAAAAASAAAAAAAAAATAAEAVDAQQLQLQQEVSSRVFAVRLVGLSQPASTGSEPVHTPAIVSQFR
jgi:SWI/SNF-related matrix-associated actin-dependent regulator 1 of chromatin subfamily A